MSETALRYLFETVEAGSMRAASDRLGIAASSISRQVAQLEQEYGIPLIERGRRVIQLTQAGLLAIEYYRGLVADRESLAMRMADLRDVRSGNLALGVGEGFLGPAFTDLIGRFRRDNPLIRVSTIIASSTGIVRHVLNDDVHFGLVLYTPAEPKIRVRSSIAQPLRAIMAPGHPLAHLPKVALADLMRHDLCLAPDEFLIRQLLRAAETRHALFLEPAVTTNSIQAMRDLASEGGVVTILPEFSARSELNDGRLVALPLDESIDGVTLSLITRVGRQLEGAPRRLLVAVEANMARWGRGRE
jgi:DNA-binding transcriptional LysR family regulator